MLNLRSIDMNLLPVFEAVYEERNLSRAAERLGMSQSAVSHALARLRDLLRDDLFIRLPQGVQRTPLADLVYLRVRDSLAGVRDLLGETRMFDPATSERRFQVSIPHPLGPLLALQMQDQLAVTAPGIVLEFNTRSLPVGLERKLEDGRVDLVVDWMVPQGGAFRTLELFNDCLMLVARPEHPGFMASGIGQLIATARFVVMRKRRRVEEIPFVQQVIGLIPEMQLLEMSEQLEVLLIASRTDRIGITPRSLGDLAKQSFGLELLPFTFGDKDIPISLIWHESRENDPAHAFLREQLASGMRQFARDNLLLPG
jgi:DNA-binding transcriptional LysR family regulator